MIPSQGGWNSSFLWIDHGDKNYVIAMLAMSQTDIYDIRPQVILEHKSLAGNDFSVSKLDGSKINHAPRTTEALKANGTHRVLQDLYDSRTLHRGEGYYEIVDERNLTAVAGTRGPAYT